MPRIAVSEGRQSYSDLGKRLTPIPDMSGFDLSSGASVQLNLGQEPVLIGAKLLAAATIAAALLAED